MLFYALLYRYSGERLIKVNTSDEDTILYHIFRLVYTVSYVSVTGTEGEGGGGGSELLQWGTSPSPAIAFLVMALEIFGR